MSKLMPEFQKIVDNTFDSMNLSDERREVLQPMIEKNINVVRDENDEESPTIKAIVVDDEGNPRLDENKKPIKISDLVKEVHEKIDNKGTPVINRSVVDASQLESGQLEDIAAGKLKVDMTNSLSKDKDAIPGSEVLGRNINLDDVSSGKTKIDINR